MDHADTRRPARHLDRLPALDSLRGAACLMVLVAHLKAIAPLHNIPDVVGTAGVGIFFALSGFLITRILIASRGDLLGFYTRRAARILPIYYLTLGVIALIWPGREVGWAAAFTFNFRFLAGTRDYFSANLGADAPPVSHFWSLCVEEHFYWLWPLLLAALPLKISRWLPFFVIAATPFLAWHLIGVLSGEGFSQVEVDGLLGRVTPLQLVGLCVGASAAFHERWLSRVSLLGISRSALAGLALIAASSTWFTESAAVPDDVARAATTTALHLMCGGAFLLVLSCGHLGGRNPIAKVGTISYGAYLYHLPIYAALGLTHLGAEVETWRGLAALGLTLALAAASFRWLEAPLMAAVRRTHGRTQPTCFRAVGAVLSLGIATAFVVNLVGATTPNVAVVEPEPAADSSLAERLQTVVVGSSHAELGFAVEEMAEPCYNMGYSSQDLYYDCGIVRKLLPRLPRLRRVVFTVSAFTFRLSVSDLESLKWMEAAYIHKWDIPPRVGGADEKRYELLAAAGDLKDYISRLGDKANVRDVPLRGWCPKPAAKFDPASGKIRAGYQAALGNARAEENRLKLIATIREVQAGGVECVLISMPTHGVYRKELPESMVREMRHGIAEVVKETGVAYFDYSADPRFTDEDFYDGDHLNVGGAVHFTRIFKAEVPLRR